MATQPIPTGMEIEATSDALKLIRARGGMLFVWIEAGMRGLRFLKTSTEPPEDALNWERTETEGRLPGVHAPQDAEAPDARPRGAGVHDEAPHQRALERLRLRRVTGITDDL